MVDMLAFGAHPDDVEIGCAGLLAKMVGRGHSCGIIDLTSGEKASQGNVETRREEALKSAALLGCAFRECLGFPDTEIRNSIEYRKKVTARLRIHRPALVLAPYFSDRHPDHAACGALVYNASFLSGLKKVEAEGEPHSVRRVVYYMIHDEFHPSFYVDISSVFETRMKALKTFESQFEKSLEEHRYIGIRDYPYFVETRCRHLGARIGKEAAEGFLVREGITVDDPFTVL
jgi:bacillithiol biosynthesis deacetylase BshB1